VGVDGVLSEPSIVLIAVSLAAALFVIEAALPTMGVAGTLAVVLGAVAVIGIVDSDDAWWPLIGPKLAVVLWAVMVARRKRSPAIEVLAVALFAGGALVFGLLADSPLAAVLGAVLGILLGAGYPRLHERARHLLESPARVGLEAFVGSDAEVVRWRGDAGTIRHEGSLWNASSADRLRAGDRVTIAGSRGSTLDVVSAVPHSAP
jgi:membrane protein implicated in regulation of membrane protease activity